MHSLIEKVKDILLDPRYFFSHLHKEHGLKDAFLYFALLQAFTMFMALLVHVVFDFSIAALIRSEYGGVPGLLGPWQPVWSSSILFIFALVGYVLSLGWGFVMAGIVHVYLLIFSGKGSYEDTYKMLAYSGTPNFLLGWIPFIGYSAIIWSLILVIIGTHHVHKMSLKKSTLIYVIPLALLMLLMVTFIIFVLSVLFPALSALSPVIID